MTDQFATALGPLHEVQLSAGALRYRDAGAGRPVVFLAGLLLHSGFYREVVPALATPIRAIVPDLPLGAHSCALRTGADCSPPAVADLIAELIRALDLRDVVVVGNDTGGAVAQLLVTRQPDRITGLVLTPCDYASNFLPPAFRALPLLARVPGGMWVLAQALRSRRVRSSPLAFGWLTNRRLDHAVYDSFLAPMRNSAAVRRDLGAALRGIDRSDTEQAAERLSGFGHPVLVVWPRRLHHFPFKHAEALTARFPDARLRPVADSLAYVPEDQPAALAHEIDEFLMLGSPAHG